MQHIGFCRVLAIPGYQINQRLNPPSSFSVNFLASFLAGISPLFLFLLTYYFKSGLVCFGLFRHMWILILWTFNLIIINCRVPMMKRLSREYRWGLRWLVLWTLKWSLISYIWFDKLIVIAPALLCPRLCASMDNNSQFYNLSHLYDRDNEHVDQIFLVWGSSPFSCNVISR